MATVVDPNAAEGQLVFTRHNGIPGRVRLQISGLRGNVGLKAVLESMESADGIREISASTVTGNALVIFDPAREVPEIVARLEIVIRRPPRSANQPPPKPPKSLTARIGVWFRNLVGGLRETTAELPAPSQRRLLANSAALAPEGLPHGWHGSSIEEVARFWQTSAATGLTAGEAAARLQRYGANVLAPIPPRSPVALLGEQLMSLPVLLLSGSAALALATGAIADAVVITAVVVLNASIGFVTEWQAERTIRSLLEISEPEAMVIRDAARHIVPGDAVVPGDLLVLRRGEPVVADARVVAAAGMTADEAALTGESLPVEKQPQPLSAGAIALAERGNMVYRGTVITGGQGLALVVGTGRHTEIGRIQDLLADSLQPETPLQRQMRQLGTQLTWLVAGISAAMFGIGLLRGFSALAMLRSAVSLAIAAVPEGLPTVATVCLARGMQSLLRERVLARRLAAVEALGTVEALCFDKTGTLTWNRMSAVSLFSDMRFYSVSGSSFLRGTRAVSAGAHPEISKLLQVCSLCSEATVNFEQGEWTTDGSATECALVRMALDGGLDVADLRRQFPLLHLEQRTEAQAYMTTRHRMPDGRVLMAIKGSPTEVLNLCERHSRGGRVCELGRGDRAEILAANGNMARRGLRVLGAALGESDSAEAESSRFVWLGLIGLADPPRHGLKTVIAEFRQAGIRPLMLTGDQAATAQAIAQELAFAGGNGTLAMTPGELEALGSETLAERLRRVSIFSRVTPSDKLQVVRALQKTGLTVAMTGDGVNDAPALKAADVGIAMGRSGTRVARGVADLLLMDDNIESLLPALREGRAVHENLRKAVHYIAATNMSEVLVMVTSIAAGLGQPFNPRQLLWINLITDVFPEIGLALAPAEPGILARPPRDPSERVIGRPEFVRLGKQSGIMTAAAMASYLFGLSLYGSGAGASTMAFLTLTSAQLLHGLTAQSERRGAEVAPNPAIRNGLAAGFALLLASQFFPGLTSLLGATRIGGAGALFCAAASCASFLANEALKPPAESQTQQATSDKDVEHANLQWAN